MSLPTWTQPTPEPAASPAVDASATERPGGLTPLSLFLVLLVAYVLFQIRLVLVLTLLALILALAVEHPLHRLERRHVPRGLGILLIYAAIVTALTLLALLVAPGCAPPARTFAHQAPGQFRALQASWRASRNPLLSGPGQRLLSRAIDAIQHPPVRRSAAMGIVTGVGGAIASGIVVFVLAFYYLTEQTLLRRLVLHEVTPSARPRVRRVWDDVEAKVGAWLRGQLLLGLFVGVSSTIAYGVLGVRFWPLLGLLAGVTGLIPVVGSWLGGVPAATIALTQSWRQALLVVGFIVVRQFLADFVLVPRIMEGAVGLSPLTVFLAVLAGTELMGPVGGWLAIPVAAAVQVIVTDALEARRAAWRASAPPRPGWRWLWDHRPAAPRSTARVPTKQCGRAQTLADRPERDR